MITLTGKQWAKIHKQIAQEYPPSHLLIRDVMKRELGFLTRLHRDWDARTGYTTTIRLDFYDDAKETWFRLKYL